MFESVTRIEIENGVSAGIFLRRIADDMVPIYEEHITRLERNISIADWYDMPETERALVIALRRVENALKNHQADAEIRQAKREAAKTRK